MLNVMLNKILILTSSNFLNYLYSKFEEMPWLLKIICGATSVLGFLQILAILFPVISPKIDGVSLTTPILMLIMGLVHMAIGWGIFVKKKIVMLVIILSPLFQYGVLYLEIGLPTKDVLQTNGMIFIGWAVFFTGYYFLSQARPYFNQSKA